MEKHRVISVVYTIEFIRQIDGKAEAVVLETMSLVGNDIASVVQHAEEYYNNIDTVPRPDGIRVRQGEEIVHEWLCDSRQKAMRMNRNLAVLSILLPAILLPVLLVFFYPF